VNMPPMADGRGGASSRPGIGQEDLESCGDGPDVSEVIVNRGI
jgi:hypothetical protein